MTPREALKTLAIAAVAWLLLCTVADECFWYPERCSIEERQRDAEVPR
jgi:hypothetical protein